MARWARGWGVWLLALAACVRTGDTGGDSGATEPSAAPCRPGDRPALGLAHGDDAWDERPLTLAVGIPPQGGAPYSRIRLRASDLDLTEGADVVITVTDAAGAWLGGAAARAGWLCANAGADADHWITTEFHVRFDGSTVDGLDGRDARVDAVVRAADGQVGWRGSATLQR